MSCCKDENFLSSFRIVATNIKKTEVGLIYALITKNEIQIAELFIYSEFRNKKFGTKLLHDALKFGQENYNVKWTTLIDTSQKTPKEQQNFFQQFGYEKLSKQQFKTSNINTKGGNISEILKNITKYLNSQGYKTNKNGYYI